MEKEGGNQRYEGVQQEQKGRSGVAQDEGVVERGEDRGTHCHCEEQR